MKEEILRRLNRRPIPIIPRRLAISQYTGEWPSPHSGKGLDFKSHRSYALGDDLRSVHMATTVRTGKKMVVERIALRDVSIIIVIDCSASMGLRRKSDILLITGLMLLFSAINMEMRIGVALVQDNGYRRLGMGTGQRHASRLFTALEDICASLGRGEEISANYPKVEAHRLMPAGGILIYLSDFIDSKGYPQPYSSFAVEARRYDFIPVVVQDEFEYSFPEFSGNSLLEFSNPETGHSDEVWIDSHERKRIKELHANRFSELDDTFSRRGIRLVHVRNPVVEQIHERLTHYFAQR